jgi:hypothetical protein
MLGMGNMYGLSWRQILCYAAPFSLTALVIVRLLFYMYPGQALNEDYAVLLQQAWNIGHGIPIDQVGVVYQLDPSAPLSSTGPLVYPPFVPILFSIPVAFVGFDIEFFKYLQLLFLAAGLVTLCQALQSWKFSLLSVTASILFFGLSAVAINAVNDLGSDIPFIFFLLIALICIERFVRAPGEQRVYWAIVSGLTIFLAINVRTVGIALVPTIIIADLMARKWHPRVDSLYPFIAIALLMTAQSLLIAQPASYGYILNFPFFPILDNLYSFYWSLARPWQSLPHVMLIELIFLASVAVAAIGVICGAIVGKPVALFGVFYAAMLLALPNFQGAAGARYLIPLMLLYGAFFVDGMMAIAEWIRLKQRTAQAVSVVSIALIAVLFYIQSPLLPPAISAIGTATPSTMSTFEYLRVRGSAGALVAVTKYRSFHLFTGLRTISPTRQAMTSMSDMLKWIRVQGVNYIVLKHSPSDLRLDFSDCPHNPLCNANDSSSGITSIFHNSDYEVLLVVQQPQRR